MNYFSPLFAELRVSRKEWKRRKAPEYERMNFWNSPNVKLTFKSFAKCNYTVCTYTLQFQLLSQNYQFTSDNY